MGCYTRPAAMVFVALTFRLSWRTLRLGSSTIECFRAIGYSIFNVRLRENHPLTT